MGSRIFLVGSGGREHALAWKLAQSELVELIVAAPGNPGIAGVPKTRVVPIGEAGARVVVEERLTGREVSMMALCDGERLALLASSEDHKAVGDGDAGPNTGGMGTYSPSALVDDALAARIVETIFLPTVRA